MAILTAIAYIVMWGIGLGTILGAIYGGVLLGEMDGLYIGAYGGLVVGLVAGLVSGGITGLVTGVVTYFFFNPPIDRKLYRSIIAALCCVCGVGIAGIGFGGVFGFNGVFTIIPALIAGAATGYAGYRFATFYPSDKAKRKNDEKPKRDDV